MNDFTKEELKPCPFCGGYPEFEYGIGNIKIQKNGMGVYEQWEISCKECSISRCFRALQLSSNEIKQMAIDWWNKRFKDE